MELFLNHLKTSALSANVSSSKKIVIDAKLISQQIMRKATSIKAIYFTMYFFPWFTLAHKYFTLALPVVLVTNPMSALIKILGKDKDMNGKTYWDDGDDDYDDDDDIESVTNWLSSRQRGWWVHIDRRSSRGQGLIHPDKICWKIRDIFLSYMRKTPTIYAEKICRKIKDMRITPTITKGLIESWQNMLSVDTHDFTLEMAFKRWLLPGTGLIEEDLKNTDSAFPSIYRGSCRGWERVHRCSGWRPNFTNTKCIYFIHMCVVQICISFYPYPYCRFIQPMMYFLLALTIINTKKENSSKTNNKFSIA